MVLRMGKRRSNIDSGNNSEKTDLPTKRVQLQKNSRKDGVSTANRRIKKAHTKSQKRNVIAKVSKQGKKKSQPVPSSKETNDDGHICVETSVIDEQNFKYDKKLEIDEFKQQISGPLKKIGVHVSMAGGLHNAVANALELGAHAFGLFLRNQRQWASKPLSNEDAERFKKAYTDANFSPNQILPHGIYLMNCASPDKASLSRSRDTLIDELKRCEKLGLTLYNFHPGSTCGKITPEEGISRIAESINIAHKETKYVVTLVENMCCQGNTIGGKFEELKAIIDKVEDKDRIGVCFDTCHAFAAGYDISSKAKLDETMNSFDTIIGLNYLKALHLNDSKGECACHLDRHENIGHGKIGVAGFKALMNDPRFDNLPMILETPECDYRREISKLYTYVK